MFLVHFAVVNPSVFIVGVPYEDCLSLFVVGVPNVDCLCVLGVPWVFWARRQQVVATLFIVVLAAVDFSTCLVVMPFTVYMELMHFNIKQDAVCKLYQVRPFNSLCNLWSPCVADADIIFCPVVSFLLSFVFFPRLISAVSDWMSVILPHMMWT